MLTEQSNEIYYAGAINGTVIAAASRNSDHSGMKEFSLVDFKKGIYKHVNIVNNKTTKMPVYIFIDPFIKTDIFFLNRFIKLAYPNSNILEFPYAGYEVLYHINKLKKLSPLITKIVTGEELAS